MDDDARRIAELERGFRREGLPNLIDVSELVAERSAVGLGEMLLTRVLDVFREEPLPKGHPFWRTERIIVLPHIGGPHPQRDRFVAELFVENLRRFLDGEPLREVVDRKAGY